MSYHNIYSHNQINTEPY